MSNYGSGCGGCCGGMDCAPNNIGCWMENPRTSHNVLIEARNQYGLPSDVVVLVRLDMPAANSYQQRYH